MSPIRYPVVLFDWGDTVMRDDPPSTVPMVQWPVVHAIDGIAAVLAHLRSTGRRSILATSADISDAAQIRGALSRAGLDIYFSAIYSFKNTGIPKGEAFYRHILADLDLPASEALMVGDSFEKDVLAANKAGIFAAWFNPRSGETHASDLHITVHSMPELLSFFQSLDRD